MKAKPLPLDHLVEIDVYRSSNPFPSGIGLLYSAGGIGLHIVDVEKVEGDAFLRQGASLASPISEEVLSRGKLSRRATGARWQIVLCLRRRSPH